MKLFNRAVRLRHAGSVLLLAVAALCSYQVVVGAIEAEIGDAQEVDVAGRQRMLSQRAALLAHRIIEGGPSPSTGHTATIADWTDTVSTLKESHAFLVARERARAEDAPAAWQALSAADGKLLALLEVTDRIQDGLERSGSISKPDLQALDHAVDDFLPPMHVAVGELATAAELRVLGAKYRLFFFLLATLFILALEVAFVFIPVQRQLEAHIADLEQARIAATAGERAKGEFLATMSHEIRTPLNGLVGLIDLLEAADRKADRARIFPVLRDSTRALTTVLNDVLDFSKLDAGGVVLESVGFDLHDLLRSVLRRYCARAENKNVVCLLDIGPRVPVRVDTDPTRLRQVLDNLLSNAVKFTPEGHVRLQATATDDGLQLAVSDTGVGIDPSQSHALFQAFTQAEASTTRRFGGTGLGLGIVARLVDAFGGTISVDGTPGVGSTFTVSFPFGRAEAPSRAPVPPQRVWVVDAVPERLAILERRLAELGHEVVGSASLADQPTNERFEQVVVCVENDPNNLALLHERLSGQSPILAAHFVVVASMARFFDPDSALQQIRRLDLTHTPTELRNALHPSAAPEQTPPEHPPSSTLLGLRVLAVDDVEVNRMVLRGMLEALGAEVAEAESAAEARHQVLAFAPHLVLMDVQMPDEGGIEATRSIFERHGENALLVVGCTASTDAATHAACRAAGMTDVLTKPLQMEELHERLAALLHKSVPAELRQVG